MVLNTSKSIPRATCGSLLRLPLASRRFGELWTVLSQDHQALGHGFSIDVARLHGEAVGVTDRARKSLVVWHGVTPPVNMPGNSLPGHNGGRPGDIRSSRSTYPLPALPWPLVSPGLPG